MSSGPVRPESFRERLDCRLALSRSTVAFALLALPALVVAVLLTVSLTLVVGGLGLAFLMVLVPANRHLAEVHRGMSGRILNCQIESSYSTAEDGSGIGRLRTWAVDSARWRDFVWIWMSATIGQVLAWMGVGLTIGWLWYLLFPFIYWVTPEGVFDVEYGLFRIDTQAEAFFEWIWVAVALFLWWKLLPVLVRARAQMDRVLLATSRGVAEG